ncbi:hypothetical protein [Auraticoccus monumenti]|uniref:Uncharacterized protein n=1 Tax=Auraticoccus monumenti TaxID=675864 RepID=A0A1G6S9T4_9ACTN|nr:hypothetical protein [Auraticoccus monumenti]SDD13431.1 hypothetical protein SAMN04489747_0262 [Auraticoccus monumenti]
MSSDQHHESEHIEHTEEHEESSGGQVSEGPNSFSDAGEVGGADAVEKSTWATSTQPDE